MAEAPSIYEILERLAPGTPMRQALERVIQGNKGALIVLGWSPEVEEASSGGFKLEGALFTPARLAELAKMDGGIILDDDLNRILYANVHFVPDGTIPTDETGARHRTADRMAIQTKKPVVAVSEGRKVVTLYYDGQKVQLDRPTEVAARVNQELQTLDRLRRRLDDAENRLTMLEVTGLATFRPVITLLQRAELVRRVGISIEQEAVSLGDEGGLMWVQLADMVRGVEHIREVTLMDYIKPRRESAVEKAINALEQLNGSDLDDPVKVGRAVGIQELDDTATPRGYRLLSKVGRLPDNVREGLVNHFRSFDDLLHASVPQLEEVEGIGSARAHQLRTFFDRLLSAAESWDPDLD
ncbi:MAG TPA: DNA integrity scanning diadenylate cyclase DisA [Acidimicrobiia bacterium]|nr:DNA integrity scanning diadenylate cyclase DisA [Acidimicrobiia bacterium]